MPKAVGGERIKNRKIVARRGSRLLFSISLLQHEIGSSLYRISGVDWSENYQLIGEFITEFEKITTSLRFLYNCILQQKGLSVWKLGEFILHIETIGPHHLSRSLCAAMMVLYPKEAQLLTDVDAIHKETASLAEKRNEIAHGEWHIGTEMGFVSDTPVLPDNLGIKRKVSKLA